MRVSKNYRLLSLTILVLASSLSAITVNRCMPFFTDEKKAFDLVPLDTKNPKPVYELAMAPFTDAGSKKLVSGAKLYFKLCKAPEAPKGCTAVPQALGYIIFSGGLCAPLTTLLSDVDRKLLHKNGKIDGVTLTYKNENLDSATKGKMKYKLRFSVTCDKEEKDAPTWKTSFEKDVIVLSTEHASGCGYGLDDLMDIFESNKIVCFVLFIGIGLLFTFFGRNAYRWTLLLAGFVIGFMLVAGVAYSFGFFVEAKTHKKWIILGIAIVVGLVFGILLFYYEKYTLSLIVGALLVLVAKAILTVFFPQLELNKWMELGLFLLVGLIGGVIAHFMRDTMLIFSTAMGGAFIVVFLIGYLTTTLESPAVIRAKIRAGEENLLAIYIWGGVWLVLGIVGIVYQCSQKEKADKNKEENEKDEKQRDLAKNSV